MIHKRFRITEFLEVAFGHVAEWVVDGWHECVSFSVVLRDIVHTFAFKMFELWYKVPDIVAGWISLYDLD